MEKLKRKPLSSPVSVKANKPNLTGILVHQLISGQKSKFKVTKCKNFEGDRVASVNLHSIECIPSSNYVRSSFTLDVRPRPMCQNIIKLCFTTQKHHLVFYVYFLKTDDLPANELLQLFLLPVQLPC